MACVRYINAHTCITLTGILTHISRESTHINRGERMPQGSEKSLYNYWEKNKIKINKNKKIHTYIL
jgi:hypothetical protein